MTRLKVSNFLLIALGWGARCQRATRAVKMDAIPLHKGPRCRSKLLLVDNLLCCASSVRSPLYGDLRLMPVEFKFRAEITYTKPVSISFWAISSVLSRENNSVYSSHHNSLRLHSFSFSLALSLHAGRVRRFRLAIFHCHQHRPTTHFFGYHCFWFRTCLIWHEPSLTTFTRYHGISQSMPHHIQMPPIPILALIVVT
jgi:hypothetical protein